MLQCQRCQNFGNNQARFKQTPRYVECGEAYHAIECNSPRNTEAKRANFGLHSANYRKFESYPQTKRNTKGETEQQQPENPLPSARKAIKQVQQKHSVKTVIAKLENLDASK